jgi:hypothetical protein
MQQNATSWERRDPSECIKIYGNDLLTDHAHVVAVSTVSNSTNSVLVFGEAYIGNVVADPSLYLNGWVCSDNPPCDIQQLLRNSTWTVSGFPIQYCLSLPVDEQCELQFNAQIMAAVLACNVVKLLVILYVTFRMPSFTSEALCTMGDALQSFLLRNDVYTKDLCLMGDGDVSELWGNLGGDARCLVPTRKGWYKSASGYLWGMVIMKCV